MLHILYFYFAFIPNDSYTYFMKYISVTQAAENWAISTRRVRLLCEQGRINGAVKSGKGWKIPANAQKPVDQRRKQWIVPQEVRELFHEIDRKQAELRKRRPLTQGEIERLREEFLIEFTYNSNAIEGNTLTLQETALVLSQGITIDQKPLKDHLEAVGHKNAFEYVLLLVQEKTRLTEKIIKETHSLVLADRKEDGGIYRRISVRIIGAKEEPPEAYLVPECMASLMTEYREKRQILHPVMAAAWFHLHFEKIHPFIDGNGRAGRLLLNLELMKNGYPSVNVKFSDRKLYYEAFDNETAMIELLGGYVLEELERYSTFSEIALVRF